MTVVAKVLCCVAPAARLVGYSAGATHHRPWRSDDGNVAVDAIAATINRANCAPDGVMHEEPKKRIQIPVDAVRECLLRELPGLRFAYLFGSAATGKMRSDSDVDIAVDAGRKLDPMTLGRVAGKLERTLGRDVDLVDILRAPPRLRKSILDHGEVLAAPDNHARLEFEMYTPKIYADWKIKNRPFEQKLLESFRS